MMSPRLVCSVAVAVAIGLVVTRHSVPLAVVDPIRRVARACIYAWFAVWSLGDSNS